MASSNAADAEIFMMMMLRVLFTETDRNSRSDERNKTATRGKGDKESHNNSGFDRCNGDFDFSHLGHHQFGEGVKSVMTVS
jgi:hypothetical protein